MDQMLTLALLAGWRTVIHEEDTAVVRLAIATARELHNPDAGGSPTRARVIDAIELSWLDRELERQAVPA